MIDFLRTNSGRGAKWSKRLHITRTDHRVNFFYLILDSSIGLWVGIQSAGECEWVLRFPAFNPGLTRERQLLSNRNHFPISEHKQIKRQVPSSLQYKTHFSRQLNCWSLRCSWSIACRRCSNYIFILNLTPGFNGLGKDNYKMRREAFKF